MNEYSQESLKGLCVGILDSENITVLNSSMLSGLSRIYILTTENKKQMKLSLPCTPYSITVKFVHCVGAGKNNMDHHIMTLVGYLAKSDAVKGIRIISNDSDFRNIVKFWRSHGVSVDQYGHTSTNANRSIVIE